nr:MAG TPA: hypothetical protein [Bacteriophage sp.]
MKKVHVYYTCHCDRENSFPQPLFEIGGNLHHSTLKDTRRDEADFSFDAEDAVADELLEVSTPFYFDDIRKTRRQMHLAEITYWHAAMHDRRIMRSDKILKVSPD